MATAQDRIEQLIRLQGQALGVLRTIQEGIAAIAAKVKDLKGGGGGAEKKEKDTGVFAKLKGVLGGIAKGFAVVSAVVAGVTAALLAVPLAVLGIVHASEKYVAALNPALVERYNQELRNLNATIGYGLTPIIQYATKSVREWAGILLGSVGQLRPLIERLSAGVSGASAGAIRLLARSLELVAHYAEALIPAWEKNLESLGAIFEVTAAVVDVLNQFGIGLKTNAGIVQLFADAFRVMTVQLAVATTKLIGAFGGLEGILKFRKSISDAIESRKNPKPGLIAAPQDSSVSGIEDIAKRMAERAFAATAGAGETKRSETDLLEEILKATAGIKPESLSKIITDGIIKGFDSIKNELRIPDRAQAVVDRLSNLDQSAGGIAAGAGVALIGTVFGGK